MSNAARAGDGERASEREATHRRTVSMFFEEVLCGGRTERIADLVAASYVHHAPRFVEHALPASGREALSARLSRSGPLRSEVKRLVADGDFVFAHVKYPGPVPIAGADIFRLDAAGRISAHWNVRQPLGGGAADIEERFASAPGLGAAADWPRAALKAHVLEMLEELWAKGDASLVPKFYSERYVQHNLEMPGGFARIREVVETDIRAYIEASGANFPIEVHHIGAQAGLVFVHLSIFMAGINRNDGDRSTNVDIFRVDQSGHMIEHWDVLQMASESLPDDSSLF